MNPDPVDNLARFTPTGPDHTELLFAAGRASARTPWFWKVGLVVSVAANAACLATLVLRAPDVNTVVLPTPPASFPAQVTVPQTDPAPPMSPPDPWSYQSLHTRTDFDGFPNMQTISGSDSGKPLSVISGRSGQLD
ncbi:MAG: hypothetical protein U0792_10195 [Gemmataceae bacterium]